MVGAEWVLVVHGDAELGIAVVVLSAEGTQSVFIRQSFPALVGWTTVAVAVGVNAVVALLIFETFEPNFTRPAIARLRFHQPGPCVATLMTFADHWALLGLVEADSYGSIVGFARAHTSMINAVALLLMTSPPEQLLLLLPALLHLLDGLADARATAAAVHAILANLAARGRGENADFAAALWYPHFSHPQGTVSASGGSTEADEELATG